MINTYNESSLHKALKNTYAQKLNGVTEKEIRGYICDVLTHDGQIVEIQTKNLGKLTAKILNLLQTHPVRLVYPLPLASWVEYYKENYLDEQPISRRKSPKNKNLYDIFDELMGVFPLLLHKNFILEIVEVHITKERIKLTEKVQSTNNKRRFLKDWISHDTTLDEVFYTRQFSCKEDYIALLPKKLETDFTITDILHGLEEQNVTKGQLYKMIWTYQKMGIIDCIGKKGRSKLFHLK